MYVEIYLMKPISNLKIVPRDIVLTDFENVTSLREKVVQFSFKK